MRPILLRYTALCLLAAMAGSVDAATVAQARALLDARDAGAPAAIAALVKAEPANAEVHLLHARLKLQQGKAKEAIEIAQTAVKLAPGNAQAHHWLGNAYGSRIGQVGMLSKMTLAPRLRDAFERAVVLDPDLLDARSSLLQFYLQAPSAIGGGIDKARAQAAEIGKRDVARGHLARAQILIAEEKPAQALLAYEAAHAAKPGDADIRMALGTGYQTAKQWDKAHAHFDRWTRDDPRAAGAWYQIGRTGALSGRYLPEGVLALERYLTMPLEPGNPERKHAYLRLGQVHAHAGNKERARIAFQAALKLDPQLADAKTELGKL